MSEASGVLKSGKAYRKRFEPMVREDRTNCQSYQAKSPEEMEETKSVAAIESRGNSLVSGRISSSHRASGLNAVDIEESRKLAETEENLVRTIFNEKERMKMEELKLDQRRLEIEKQLLYERELMEKELLQKKRDRLRGELETREETRTQSSRRSASVKSWVNAIPDSISAKNNLRTDAQPGEEASYRLINQDMGELIGKGITKGLEGLISKLGVGSPAATTEKYIVRQTTKDLPEFNGNPMDWPIFISRFDATTRCCQFTDVENLDRLQKALRGRARESVKSLLICPANVGKIIVTLEARYGRPDYIVEELISNVKRLPSPSEEKLYSVVEFADKVNNLAAMVVSLKCENHLRNPMLVKDLVEKLPSNLKMQWALAPKGDRPGLEVFANWLMTLAEALGEVVSPKPVRDEQGKQDEGRDRKRINSVQQEGKSMSCLYCHKPNHKMTSCFKFKGLDATQRRKYAKEKGICFVCLHYGHFVHECTDERRCRLCERRHHILLPCLAQFLTAQPKKTDNQATKSLAPTLKEPAPESAGETAEVKTISAGRTKRVLLKILPVVLSGPRGSVSTYAFLDDGASVSIINEELVRQIGAEGERSIFHWKGAMNVPGQESSMVVDVKIAGSRPGSREFLVKGVRSVKNIGIDPQTIDMDTLKEEWRHLQHIPFESLANARPSILLGQEHWSLFFPQRGSRGSHIGPAAVKTLLGWVVHGTLPGGEWKPSVHHLCSKEYQLDEIHQLVKEQWKTESFGVVVKKENLRSREDRRAEAIMVETTRRVGGKFQTGLLWRDPEVQLPRSKPMALRRLHLLERKLDKEPATAVVYCNKMQEYIDKGYAAAVPAGQLTTRPSKEWYVPHFAVTNPNKPGKVRIVFDAAAETSGVSLNSALLTGPDLFNNLVGILMRMREEEVAVAADVKEMFPQIKIAPEDSVAQRFLWRGMNRVVEPKVYEMSSMLFGAVCSPASAQFVMRKNAEEWQKEFPEAVEPVFRNHYMDDYLDSFRSVATARLTVKAIVEVDRRGGFQICNWVASHPQALEGIPLELKADIMKMDRANVSAMWEWEEKSDTPTERVLGVHWNPKLDEFSFTTKFHKVKEEILRGTQIPTKREVLGLTMSVFDPLGFLAHFTVYPKILIQDIWRVGVGWDDEIPQDIFERWSGWVVELLRIPTLKIPRCYCALYSDQIELHVFCDASDRAFAAVCYFRGVVDGKVKVSFVTARARVAPLKQMSIPRLELQAAVLATRLCKTVKEEHRKHITSTTFWSDSKTVLAWIRAERKRFQSFVAHRIGEIWESTDVHEWRWLPTIENVADEATKWSRAPIFDSRSRWYSGPAFLRLHSTMWPREEGNAGDDEHLLETINVLQEEEIRVFPVPNVRQFSSYLKFIRAVAWFLRAVEKFGNNLQRKRKVSKVDWNFPRISNDNEEANRLPFTLSADELKRAEMVAWRAAQWDGFPKEMELLSKKLSLHRRSSLLQLSPELDADGVVRMNSRTERTTSQSEYRKCILPQKHPTTRLLVDYFHRRVGHNGREMVVNELRKKVWIPNVRVAVRSSWSRCLRCRIARAKPRPPLMANLPAERLDHHTPPFTHTGMDCFGPLKVTVGRRKEERLGVLFTCLSTRAVHIEVAHTQSADSMIMALRRFMARRGTPRTLFSDNGRNFIGAERELKEAINAMEDVKLREEMAQHGICRKFIPPGAPHMGGAWERMVQAVKKALYASLHTMAPRPEVLETLLVEAEHLVNSRPLTYVSTNPEDDDAITPNDILVPGAQGLKLIGDTDKKPNYQKMWRNAQALVDRFWDRWVQEYLPALSPRSKWCTRGKDVAVGDVVIVIDSNIVRNTWLKGIIEEVFPGQDGVVRSVRVRTKDGSYHRPATKIAVIDLEESEGT